MTHYHHTQIGWPVIAVAVVLLPLVMGASGGFEQLSLPILLALPIALVFGSLTVAVDHRRLSWRFGVGFIRKSLPVADIRSIRAVRNPWHYGWGIRLTPVGWLYNVSGLSAIEVLLNDGRHVLIGTDQPEALERALQQVVVMAEPRESVVWTPTVKSRRTALLVILGINAVVVPVICWSFYAGMQPPSVTVSPAGFSVHGGGLYSADVPIRDIQEISLQDTIPRVVRKTSGFNAGNTLRGNFRLDVLGHGKLFINRGVPPYVVVKTPDSFVIVNFDDPERTRALYADLRRYVGSK
jgi:hypothetical protein